MSVGQRDQVGAVEIAGRRRRWQVWRSPGDQPAWARPALLVVAAVTGGLFASVLRWPGYAPQYASAVRSMSESWKAFLYGAADLDSTSTMDKLAGSFLPQALSARVFGFHEWSLALPQVVEGVVTVLVAYRLVRRWFGPAAGLLGAALLGLTPVVTSVFGHGMEDGALTACLVLAADSWQRSVVEGRPRSLLAAAAWVGAGFQCKMMQAWLVVPALFVGYLVLAPVPARRRLAHALAFGAVALAASLAWVGLYTVTPAADRPYIDGSTNNSAVAMVFGFNGLDRLGIHVVPGVERRAKGRAETVSTFTGSGSDAPPPKGGPVTSGSGPRVQRGGSGPSQRAGGGPTLRTGDSAGWTKLATGRYATQTGWLYPLALLGLVLGLWWHRRAPRTDVARGGFLVWGLWTATAALVLSAMSLPHTAYVATLSVSVAALAAAGTVLCWRAYRSGGARAWALPAVVAAETAWTVHVAWPYRGFLPGLLPAVGAIGGLAAIVLALNLVRPVVRGRLLTGALAAGVGAMLLTPAAWSASVLDPRYTGDSFDASAGPVATPARRGAKGDAERRLVAYIRAHRHGRDDFATTSWGTDDTIIEYAGARVLPVGGFDGTTPSPTPAAFRRLVASGRLRYVMTGPVAGATFSSASNTAINRWVHAHCAEIPASAYGGAADGSGQGTYTAGGAGNADTLYDCG